MYRGFSLKIDESHCSEILKNLNSNARNLNFNRNFYNQYDPSFEQILIENIVNQQSLDAEKIKGDWFPTIESDIFISHSHRDLDTVEKLATIFSKYLKLKVFIDSKVWKYSDNLVQMIEEKYCVSEKSIHDKIVAHVNIMLSSALTKMLNKTECVIFLNSENSLIPNKYSNSAQTDSPWIYYELFITSLLPVKSPNRKMPFEIRNEAQQFQILHTVPLNHLTDLDCIDFKNWIEKSVTSNENSLDVLYRLKPAKISPSNSYK